MLISIHLSLHLRACNVEETVPEPVRDTGRGRVAKSSHRLAGTIIEHDKYLPQYPSARLRNSWRFSSFEREPPVFRSWLDGMLMRAVSGPLSR